jgi:hypothetical protein
MATDRRQVVIKQPTETFDIDIDFTNVFALSDIDLVSASATVIKWPRKFPTQTTPAPEVLASPTGFVLPDSCNCACGQIARFKVQGGISDYEYKITVLGVFSNNSVIEHEVYMRVREE